MTWALISPIFNEELYRLPARVTIVIPSPWKEMAPSEIELLSKILASVNLPLEGVQIMESKNNLLSENSALKPTCILSFGASLQDSDKYYEILEINHIPYVVAHKLDQLNESRKKQLWAALKQMFKPGS